MKPTIDMNLVMATVDHLKKKCHWEEVNHLVLAWDAALKPQAPIAPPVEEAPALEN